MFNIDERLKGLPALKEQVVQLYSSLNQPHLAVPGRRAGPATAFVLGLRGPSGFAVFVYLYLPESAECAVYVPSGGTVPPDQYQSEEAEALGFVESMGFIMDNLNFRARPPDEQDQLIRTLAVFQREPPLGAPQAAPPVTPVKGQTGRHGALGRLFSAFCVAALVAIAPGCRHWVSEAEAEQSRAHYDLAVDALVKRPSESIKEVEASLKLNPENADAWHVKGILLHTAFGRLPEAQEAYQKAIELKPTLSEARTNLGNLFMDLKRYDDAISQYEVALNDVMYGAPFIAHGNMGWAYFKKGDVKQSLDHLKAAVTINPKYCLGHFQLGQVYDAQEQPADACKAYGKFREVCPDRPDAYLREGVCQAKLGNREAAQKSLTACAEKSGDEELRTQCKSLQEQLLK